MATMFHNMIYAVVWAVSYMVVVVPLWDKAGAEGAWIPKLTSAFLGMTILAHLNKQDYYRKG